MKCSHALLAGLMACVVGALDLRAEIPEPDTVFYGRIVNRTSGQVYTLTNGTLIWTILPASGPAITLTAQLAPLAGGQFSYQVKVPHQALVSGTLLASNVVPLSPVSTDYLLYQITVDGVPAVVMPPAEPEFSMSQQTRAATHRLDLELFNPLPDSDGDGMPDWWEDRYGLNKYWAADAWLDLDGDGASNLKELTDGTDPTQGNTSPVLANSTLQVPEGGTVGLRLQTLDSDSLPAALLYTLLAPPQGGTLSLRNGVIPGAPGELATDRVLEPNDTFTQADVNAGRLLFKHQNFSVTNASFALVVRDENTNHPASTGSVALVVYAPVVSESQPPGLWLDASRNNSFTTSASGSPLWLDRSARGFNATLSSHTAPALANDSPAGHTSLVSSGELWDFAPGDGAEIFPAGARTLFAVFKPLGLARQQALGGIRFEMGVTSSDDPHHPDALRYGTDAGALYGQAPAHNRWLLATVSDQGSRASMEMNGLFCQGPILKPETTSLANKNSLAGKAIGQYDAATKTWQYTAAEQLQGGLAEILTFNCNLTPDQRQKINHSLLSKWLGYVLWDASAEAQPMKISVPSAGLTPSAYSNYIVLHGRDYPNILIGGSGPDELAGGMENDILVGGPGNDLLAGGGGNDSFTFGPYDGNDTILDFNPAEGDVLDISRCLLGSSQNLADYVQFSTAGTNSWLCINYQGQGATAGFTNMAITLANNVFRQSDLPFLYANGYLVTGGIGIGGPAWVNITATVPNASEEGPTPGEFTLTRTGSADSSLTVHLAFSGTALNGVDYSFINSTITFQPGQSSLKIPVQPYPDNLLELPEIVEVMLLTNTTYNLGLAARAQVTIGDLPERISIEAFEPVAGRIGQVPGYFALRRTGVLDHTTVVRLGAGGSAVNGADYQRVSLVVTFNAGQSSLLIPIVPLAGLPALAHPKTVELRILADSGATYQLGTVSTAKVWFVEETMDLSLWRARFLPGETADLPLLAARDSDHDGIPNLLEYAFGLNPAAADNTVAKAGLPCATIRNGHLAVQFKKHVAAADLEYTVELSEDLVSWRDSGASVQEITLPEFAGTPEMVCYQESTLLQNSQHRFIRVRVRLK